MPINHLSLPLAALLAITGCQNTPQSQVNLASSQATSQRIEPGMLLNDAIAILKSHQAKGTAYQVMPSRKNEHLHWFTIPDGRVLEFTSVANQSGQHSITNLYLSTYQPKSWQSKIDPERTRFFASFQPLTHYDFTGKPEKK